jgi:hypothetical protein
VSRLAKTFAAAALASLAFTADRDARADLCDPVPTVFEGDPCDPASGPLPMMPGLPLVLPEKGPTGTWNTGPVSITTGLTGDVDLAVRVGLFPDATEIPAPAGSSTNPTLLQSVAGGGGSIQGASVDFTTFVTDGPGTYPYGAPLAGLETRPLAVFGYADLDGDGVVGPTDADGGVDNELERQEAIAHVGRQVGQIGVDRFSNALAVRIGAPASIGGLRVSLVAGMYTGDDPGRLWSNGTPIFTNWPFFPPLDPMTIVYLDEPNPPDPSGPNILFYQPSEFYLPDPATTDLVEAFALPNDGSNGTTDQFISLSGAAVGARLFRDVVPSSYSASSRLVVRPAPSTTGLTRKLVTPAGEVAVKAGRNVVLRLLPVDALGNIADPDPLGIPIKITAEKGLRITLPDVDGDPYSETLSVMTARGVSIKISTDEAELGRARVTVYDPPPAMPIGLDQALVFVSDTGDIDLDDDGIRDDGDGSGTLGDNPCTNADVQNDEPCDDNCPEVVNPSQNDSDGDGQGNCCDGSCVINDADAGCLECPQAASRFRAVNTRARMMIRPRAGLDDDVVRVRTLLRLEEGQAVAPDAEAMDVTIAEGDRLHYFVQLPGVFNVVDDRPTYEYEDPSKPFGGVYHAKLRTTRRGLKVRVRARELDLVDTAPAEVLANGLVLAVTIGDDTFSRHLKCTTTLRAVRCVSTN